MSTADRARLAGAVAIVTGASKGIGRAAAAALAGAGADVVVVGRSGGAGGGTVDQTVRLIESRGGRGIAVRCDLRDENDVDRAVETTLDRFGRVDVLVNNAGIYAPARPSWEIAVRWWDDVLDTNLRGTFLCCRAVIPHLLQDGGSIVNVTSMAAEPGFPAGVVDVAYATSKQAVNRLTSHLADELRPHRIAVNALSPVRIRTEGVIAGWGVDADLEGYAEPDVIGPLVTFLAGCRTEFTGRIVRRDQFVDGVYRPDVDSEPLRFPKPSAGDTTIAPKTQRLSSRRPSSS